MLNSFAQGYVKDAIASFYGRRKPENEYMRKGRKLHKLLGFDNQEKFSYTFKLDDDYVELVGLVDYIDKNRRIIKELKTLYNYSGWIPEKKIEGAKVQLEAYLMVYGYDIGEIVFVDASAWDENGKSLPPVVKKVFVRRNDEHVKDVIRRFIEEIKSQNRITIYLNPKEEIEGG